MQYVTPSPLGLVIDDRLLGEFLSSSRYFEDYEAVAIFYYDGDREQDRVRFVINTRIQPDLSKWGVGHAPLHLTVRCIKFVVIDAGLQMNSWDVLNMSPQEIRVMLKTDAVSYRQSSFEEDVRGANPVIVCMGNEPADLLRTIGHKRFCMCLNLFV